VIHPVLRTYVVLSDELMRCCAAVAMGVSIGGSVRFHSMDGLALSGADVQASWHSLQETV